MGIMNSPALVDIGTGIAFRPDSSCVLWLPGQDDAFSSTIRDRSGFGNNGAITGAEWDRIGTGLWTLKGDGDDSVNVGAVGNAAAEFWFSIWFIYSGTSQQYIFHKDSGAGRVFLYKPDSDANLKLRTLGFGVNVNFTVATPSVNVWHHAFFSTSSTNGYRARLDGGSAVTNATANPSPNGGDVIIGDASTASGVGIVGNWALPTIGINAIAPEYEVWLYQSQRHLFRV